LLASESRGALIAAIIAVTVILATLWGSMRAIALLGLFMGSLVAWMASLSLISTQPFQRVLTVIGLGDVAFGHVTDANFSAVERAAHWLAGVRMFASHPILGVGIGNYADAYPRYHPRGWYDPLAHAHNYYINIAAEAGVIGLLAYLLLAGSALWYTCAAMRYVRTGVPCAVVLGVLGALVTISVHNIFDVLYVHGMVALLGLLLALVSASVRAGSAPGSGDPLYVPVTT
jgi:O-antigen ligase